MPIKKICQSLDTGIVGWSLRSKRVSLGLSLLNACLLTTSRQRASEKAMAPHSSTLAWKSHGWRSLVGCSPWGREESHTTERLHLHFSRSCTGEGNGNPLQCSCLENPREGGAWWAAIYGVAQSQTRLRWLSSSSSSSRQRACPRCFPTFTFDRVLKTRFDVPCEGSKKLVRYTPRRKIRRSPYKFIVAI